MASTNNRAAFPPSDARNPAKAGACEVLEVLFRGYCHSGVESYLEALLPRIAEQNIQVTLLVLGPIDRATRLLWADKGVATIELPAPDAPRHSNRWARRIATIRNIRLALRSVLRVRAYDAVHLHSATPAYLRAGLIEAHRAHVPLRIAHSHSAIPHKSLRYLLQTPAFHWSYTVYATHLLACSHIAGEDTFGKKTWESRGILARNGIDIDHFQFNPEKRTALREKCPEAFVIGTVGTLSARKNTLFSIRTFAAVKRLEPRARLWLIGDGPLRTQAEALVRELHLEDSVMFWGDRDGVADILQAMDCFLMPSVYEGLPIALLEAQASGLPCVISDTISPEALIPGLAHARLSLDCSFEDWARAILEMEHARTPDGARLLRHAGFDAHESAQSIARLYRQDEEASHSPIVPPTPAC